MLKTISGLSKVRLVRLDTGRATQGFLYQMQIVRKVSGYDAAIGLVRPMHELANIYLSKDVEDVRCSQLCEQAQEIVENSLGPDDPNNYLRAKAIAQVAKVVLARKNQERTDELFSQALSLITTSFGNEHPLVAKFR